MNIARRSSSGNSRQGMSPPLIQTEPPWRNGERQINYFTQNGLPDGRILRMGNERGMYIFFNEMMCRKREDGGELEFTAKRI